MPFTVIYERAPQCRTCRATLTEWWMFAENPRCPTCERRACDIDIRRIFHDAKMQYVHKVKPSEKDKQGGGKGGGET